MISALLSENAYLKGQLQRYVMENDELRKQLLRKSGQYSHDGRLVVGESDITI